MCIMWLFVLFNIISGTPNSPLLRCCCCLIPGTTTTSLFFHLDRWVLHIGITWFLGCLVVSDLMLAFFSQSILILSFSIIKNFQRWDFFSSSHHCVFSTYSLSQFLFVDNDGFFVFTYFYVWFLIVAMI